MNIIKNEPLSQHTTFQVGGSARYFCVVKNIDEIKQALDFVKEKNIDYFILAGGSNVIVSDEGYDGLVIKTELTNISINNYSIKVGSGFVLDKLVDIANAKGMKGLEWAGGLPGTVGGAVSGNAGAFEGEIKDIVADVKTLSFIGDAQTTDSNNPKIKNQKSKLQFKIQNYSNRGCKFGYRDSIFKHNNEIILEVELQMKKGDSEELKNTADEHRQYRQEKHPMNFPSAGSIFKNIPTKSCTYDVQERFKDVIKTDPFPVIPVAAIIDKAGLKGYTIGGAQISKKHPNYIINLSNAKAQDVVDIIGFVIKAVKQKYNINLEVEPQLLGFDKKYSWESR